MKTKWRTPVFHSTAAYLYPMNPPLLLLHGALGSAAQFDPLLPLLPADFEVHTLNFPGHGGTPAAEPFSIGYFARFVLDFLDRKNIERVQIFGYSMGGYTALQLALLAPERVVRVVTLGTKFGWTPEVAARETTLLNADKIAAKVPLFAQLLAERHAPGDWKSVLQQTADLLHDLGNGSALKLEDFAQISCPVLIGLGADDHMVGREESENVAQALPQGRLDILPGVKHPFEQVDPDLLAHWLCQQFN